MIDDIVRTQVRQTQDRLLLKAFLRIMRTMLANHARAVDNELRGYRRREDDLWRGMIKLNSRVNQLEKQQKR